VGLAVAYRPSRDANEMAGGVGSSPVGSCLAACCKIAWSRPTLSPNSGSGFVLGSESSCWSCRAGIVYHCSARVIAKTAETGSHWGERRRLWIGRESAW
jgi:hypothetical protein